MIPDYELFILPPKYSSLNEAKKQNLRSHAGDHSNVFEVTKIQNTIQAIIMEIRKRGQYRGSPANN